MMERRGMWPFSHCSRDYGHTPETVDQIFRFKLQETLWKHIGNTLTTWGDRNRGDLHLVSSIVHGITRCTANDNSTQSTWTHCWDTSKPIWNRVAKGSHRIVVPLLDRNTVPSPKIYENNNNRRNMYDLFNQKYVRHCVGHMEWLKLYTPPDRWTHKNQHS